MLLDRLAVATCYVRDPCVYSSPKAVRIETHATDHDRTGIPGVVARICWCPGMAAAPCGGDFATWLEGVEAGSRRGGHLAADDPVGAGRSYLRSEHHRSAIIPRASSGRASSSFPAAWCRRGWPAAKLLKQYGADLQPDRTAIWRAGCRSSSPSGDWKPISAPIPANSRPFVRWLRSPMIAAGLTSFAPK